MENRLSVSNGKKNLIKERATSLIDSAIRRYENENPRPDSRPQDRVFLAWYRNGLIYISETIKELSISDIDTLDSLFRNVYIPFSLKNGVTPKIIDFCMLTGIDYTNIYTVINSNTNTNSNYFKHILNNWLILCKEFLISNLSDESNSNINNIFVLKSVYGLTDQPKQDNSTTRNTIKTDRQAIIAELNGENVENPGDVENFNEQDS